MRSRLKVTRWYVILSLHCSFDSLLRVVQIHPIPPFSSTDALTQVIQRMEQAGIYLMYDMR